MQKMINFDDVTKENIKKHNRNWQQIPYHPYPVLKIEGSGYGNKNSLFDLSSQQPDINKNVLYAKDTFETKYKFLINKRESTDLKHLNDFKVFIEYSNRIDDIYKNTEEYNLDKKRKMIIFFDYMIAAILRNKEVNAIVTKLFIRGRKLNVSLFLIMQCYLVVPKNLIINSTHYFIMKISNER